MTHSENVELAARLAFLIPYLQPAEAVILAERDRRRILARILAEEANIPVEYLLAVVQTIRSVGDIAAIGLMQKLMVYDRSGDDGDDLRNAATECLARLELRARYDRDARTLLRPADAPHPDADVLLRPAWGIGEADPDVLLRPSSAPESESSPDVDS